jgi:hypothetical protein
MREWRICASEERRVPWTDYVAAQRAAGLDGRKARGKKAHVQTLKVLAHFEHKLLRSFLALREVVAWRVRLGESEQ